MAHDVFISYAHEDKAIADVICSIAEAQRIRCWIAPRDVATGIKSSYGASIIDAINNTKIVVMVFSSNANASQFVSKEIERAASKGKPIIPFRIENVMPSEDIELFISSQNWIDAITKPVEQHIEKIVNIIHGLLMSIYQNESTEKSNIKQIVQPENRTAQMTPPEKINSMKNELYQEDEGAWRMACREGTVESYERYINGQTLLNHLKEANDLICKLKEEIKKDLSDWINALWEGTVTAYKRYLTGSGVRDYTEHAYSRIRELTAPDDAAPKNEPVLNYPIQWKEPAIEQAVRKYLEKPVGVITSANLLDVTTLIINENDVTINVQYFPIWGEVKGDFTTLIDLIHFANLNEFAIAGNRNADLSILPRLKKITRLNLRYNELTDISVLAGLKNLEILDIDYNKITDIAILAELTKLTKLSLDENRITDIRVLSELENLNILSLSKNQITDISALERLTKLSELRLHYNQITDIKALAGLTNLTELNLDNNQITEIKALAGLTKLSELNLEDNKITDISALAGLTKLTELNLNFNQITNVSTLAGLKELSRLFFYKNQITSISALAGLTKLTVLKLARNQITDVSALAGLTNLTELNLYGNRITDISALSSLDSLTALYLGANEITDISSIVRLKNLLILNIESNRITNIDVITNFIKLKRIDIGFNKIKDRTPLRLLPKNCEINK